GVALTNLNVIGNGTNKTLISASGLPTGEPDWAPLLHEPVSHGVIHGLEETLLGLTPFTSRSQSERIEEAHAAFRSHVLPPGSRIHVRSRRVRASLNKHRGDTSR